MMIRMIGFGCLVAGIICSRAEGLVSQSYSIDDFYCENSYTNFAWGYQHRGRYVDGQGRVFAFGSESSDVSAKASPPAQSDSLTQQELEQKYSHGRRQVGTVNAQSLNDARRWLSDARSGSLSPKVRRAFDMGTGASSCWIREAGTERYRTIELAVDGDWRYRNTAPAAGELVRWLESVTKTK